MEQFNQRIATELFWHLEAGTGALSISIYYFPVSLHLLTGPSSPPLTPHPRARTHWGMSRRTHTKWGPAHARHPSSPRPASVLNVPLLASIPPYPRLGPPCAHHETRRVRGVERDCIPDATHAAPPSQQAGALRARADRRTASPSLAAPPPASPSRAAASPSRTAASPSRAAASPSRAAASPSRAATSPSRAAASPSRAKRRGLAQEAGARRRHLAPAAASGPPPHELRHFD